jgi:cell division protein FtsQ
MPFVKRGFFAVDVAMIKERINQFPWVADATVSRVWPNQVVIHVSEKTALARWNNDHLLSTNGDIFTPNPNTLPPDIPYFVGPEGKHIAMIENFNKINSLLSPLQFKISRLELNPADTWNLTLDNGIKIKMGRKEVLTKISQFVKVYPKIISGRTSEIDSIDLRYSNGLAVRWKTIS